MTQTAKPDWTPLRNRLLARQKELRAEIDNAESSMDGTESAWQGEVMDTKDAAKKEANLDLRRTEILRDRAELAEATIALQRMDAGVYGECIDCGEDIDIKRLEARPESVRCLQCEEKFEASAR